LVTIIRSTWMTEGGTDFGAAAGGGAADPHAVAAATVSDSRIQGFMTGSDRRPGLVFQGMNGRTRGYFTERMRDART
jgi:hypothetical protein